VKSKFIDQQLDRRNLNHLVAIRFLIAVFQIASTAALALLRVMIFDLTALLWREQLPRLARVTRLATSFSTRRLLATSAGLCPSIRRGGLGRVLRIALQLFLQIFVFFLQSGKLLLQLGKLLLQSGKLLL
jgi:hypothetical protein